MNPHLSAAAPAGARAPPPGARRNEWRAVRMVVPYLWEYRGRVLLALSFPGRGQARQRRRAAGNERDRRYARRPPGGAAAAAGAADHLRRAAPVEHAVRGTARRRLRARRAARDPAHCADGVPPSAQPEPALSSRPPDRRHHARHRARHARHRHAHELHAVLDHSGDTRVRAGGGGAAEQVRLAFRRHHVRRGRDLHRLYLQRRRNGASRSGATPTNSIRAPTRAPSTACSTTRPSSISTTKNSKRGATTKTCRATRRRRSKTRPRSDC